MSRLCPQDRSPLALALDDSRYECSSGHSYTRGGHGFWELARPESTALSIETTSEHCASIQETGGARVYERYLKDWLTRNEAHTVLDAGCGIGQDVVEMRRDGFDGVGVDVSSVAGLWAGLGRDRDSFVVGDVTSLPFPTDHFDAVISLGVVEHVGTVNGHLTLASDYRAQRARFAAELQRVTRPGGRILIACPNKRFPIDIQHGPADGLSRPALRTKLFERTGINLHPTWGRYHLASFADLREWFGAERVRPLPLTGYFGFSALDRTGALSRLRRVAQTYVDNMPARLRGTALNPYVLAEVNC